MFGAMTLITPAHCIGKINDVAPRDEVRHGQMRR